MHTSLSLAEDIKDTLHQILGKSAGFVPLHEPEFNGEEETLVTDCIRSGWVSSVGKYVDSFEQEVAKACGAKYGVAVVNGTAALEVALRVAGVVPGDEVLMPSLTFIATANATHHLGAIPHFVDADPIHLGISAPALLAHLEKIGEMRKGHLYNGTTGRRISAMVPMHVFGHPVDMDDLSVIAEQFGIILIEDAAESLGSRYKGKPCGGIGKLGALSFNGNKILTTGGGGAIVTNDEELAHRAKHLTTTAKVPHRWAFFHDEIGYNYRMPNLNAALGVAQIRQLDERIMKKRDLAAGYIAAFADHACVSVLTDRPGVQSNYWLNTLLLAPHVAAARDDVLAVLNTAGLMARPIWEPLHTLPIYAGAPHSDLSVTETLATQVINIPSSAHLAARLP